MMKQGWRDSNPQPPVLETGALPNWSYTPLAGFISLARSIPVSDSFLNPETRRPTRSVRECTCMQPFDSRW